MPLLNGLNSLRAKCLWASWRRRQLCWREQVNSLIWLHHANGNAIKFLRAPPTQPFFLPLFPLANGNLWKLEKIIFSYHCCRRDCMKFFLKETSRHFSKEHLMLRWYFWQGMMTFLKNFHQFSIPFHYIKRNFMMQNSQIFKVHYWKWNLKWGRHFVCIRLRFFYFSLKTAECKAPWNCIFRINLFSFFLTKKSFLLFSFCRRWHDSMWTLPMRRYWRYACMYVLLLFMYKEMSNTIFLQFKVFFFHSKMIIFCI